MRTCIEQTRNLMTIRIALEIVMYTVAGYAERFGVYNPMRPYLANALGAQETTMFQMIAAYAMFANGGERVEPTLVDRVQDRWGRTIYRHDQRSCTDCNIDQLPSGEAPQIVSNRERVMDAITAYQLTSMMEGVVQRGSGTGVRLPVPVAGKTGTTQAARDAWFIGFTGDYVTGIWMGNDDNTPLKGVTGGGLPAEIWHDVMVKVSAGTPAVPLPKADPSEWRNNIAQQGFGGETYSTAPQGNVSAWTPPAPVPQQEKEPDIAERILMEVLGVITGKN